MLSRSEASVPLVSSFVIRHSNWGCMQDQLARAEALDADGKPDEARALLSDLAAAHPDDPQALFRVACTCDGLGYERDAIPRYARAIELGLDGDRSPDGPRQPRLIPPRHRPV